MVVVAAFSQAIACLLWLHFPVPQHQTLSSQNRCTQPHSGGQTANLLPDKQICCVPCVDTAEALCAHILPTHLQASWQQMNRRHEELLEQVKILKARLSRMGALDEDAMRNDIQDYKSCPEVFDRYGNPVRVAESVRAMWPCGLPPPTDPRLVKSVVKLNMPPEELAFHVSTPLFHFVAVAFSVILALVANSLHVIIISQDLVHAFMTYHIGALSG